ncbi:Actin-related protein 2/3 complex subunit 5 [Plasmodiophora brassicae]|nr:hypothetical protein PBRA_003607 [Plasmodiophora brassicae]
MADDDNDDQGVVFVSTGGTEGLDHVEAKVADTKELLKANASKALVHALSDPPVNFCQVAKDLARDAVLDCMNAIKDDDIDKQIAELSLEEQDMLLKYIYRGFAIGEGAASWLKWHAKIVERNGIGAIVRVLTQGKKAV